MHVEHRCLPLLLRRERSVAVVCSEARRGWNVVLEGLEAVVGVEGL
jgi:hypothetical protein